MSEYYKPQIIEEKPRKKPEMKPKEELDILEQEKNQKEEIDINSLDYKNFDFDQLKDISEKYHKEIALKLMEAGHSYSVAENLEKFTGLNKEIALKLMEAGHSYSVAKNLENFSGLDKEVALKLVEVRGTVRYVAKNLDKFINLDKKDHKEIVLKIIKFGTFEYDFHYYLNNFKDLDKEVALKLIEVGKGYSVVNNLDNFTRLELDKKLALKLIEAGKIQSVVQNLENFTDISEEDHQELALKIGKTEDSRFFYYNSEKFTGCKLDKKLALKLIEAGSGRDFANNIEIFTYISEKDHQELALKLIEAGKIQSVARNLEKFSGLKLNKELVLKFIENGDSMCLARNLYEFKGFGLDKEIALKIIEDRNEVYMREKLDEFIILDKEIALKFIEVGDIYFVDNELDKFSGLDKEIALKLIEVGKSSAVDKNLDKFSGLDKEVVLKLIEVGEGYNIASNLDKFSGLELNKELILKFIEKDIYYIKVIAENLDKFIEMSEEDYKEIALKFIEVGESSDVAKNLKKFTGLDKEIALKLIEAGKIQSVVGNLDKFSGLNKSEKINLNLNFPKNITFGDLEKIYNINQIGDRLLGSIRGLNNFDYNKQIKPVIAAQGDGAFMYFNSIKKINNYQNLSTENVNYLIHIAKKYNTQARNILENIILKLDNENFVEEKKIIDEFLKDVSITDINIYNEFKIAIENNDKEKIKEIKENVNEIKNAIYSGDVDEDMENNSLYEAVQYYVFPPALGLDQDQYKRLNEERSNREGDVPKELEDLQYEEFEVGTGHFELGENEELNLDTWSTLSEVVKEKNKKFENENKIKKIDLDKNSLTLIDIYYDKNKKTRQKELFEIMYEYHLSIDGGKLETGFDISQAGLMKYKEFIGDRIKNDLVKKSLEYLKEKNNEKYNEVKTDILNRLKGTEDAEFKKLNAIYNSISKAKNETKKNKIIEKFDDLSKHFGLNYNLVNKSGGLEKFKREINSVDIDIFEDDQETYENNREKYYASSEFQRALEVYLNKYDEDRVITQAIGAGLVGDINKNMRKEIDKFSFNEDEGGEKKQKLTSIISKKREHGVAGYNMGICVTPDKELWNNPDYALQILFNPENKQAMGGMNLLVVGEDLALPGINPSMDILANTNNEELYDEMIKIAKEIQEKLNLKRLLIPTQSEIHSNRQQIQEIIRNKNYKKVNLEKEAEFSYDPYRYSFQECFVVNTIKVFQKNKIIKREIKHKEYSDEDYEDIIRNRSIT